MDEGILEVGFHRPGGRERLLARHHAGMHAICLPHRAGHLEATARLLVIGR